MERILNRDFSWVNYNNNIVGYNNEKNIFYKFNQSNNLTLLNTIYSINTREEILLISNKELDFLLDLRTRNLPSLESHISLEKYFNRIKVINSIL
jgi:hypothetical protein